MMDEALATGPPARDLHGGLMLLHLLDDLGGHPQVDPALIFYNPLS
jgi:hypothetical protein